MKNNFFYLLLSISLILNIFAMDWENIGEFNSGRALLDYDVTFTPDEKYLIHILNSACIRIYDIDNKTYKDIPLDGYKDNLKFSTSGRYLFAANWPYSDDRNFSIYDLINGKKIRETKDFERRMTILSVAFSQDDRYVAISSHGVLLIWDIATGQMRHVRCSASVSLSFGKQNNLAMLTTTDNVLEYNVNNKKLRETFFPKSLRYKSCNNHTELTYSQDGTLFALPGKNTINIYNEYFEKLHKLPKEPNYNYNKLKFSGDNKYFITLSTKRDFLEGDKDLITIWDVKTGQIIFKINKNFVRDLAISSTAKYVTLSYIGDKVELYKIKLKKYEDIKSKDNICNKCLKPASSRCGRCLKIFYCSKECQQQDWIKHKLNCVASKVIAKIE